MKSLFVQLGGTYRKVSDYDNPNLEMPDIENFKMGIYSLMSYDTIKNEYGNSV